MQLVAEDLVLSRGGRVIVDRLSFTVASGEALLLTGRNGAGKTTLIRGLAGFLAPTSGKVRLDGFDPERDMREACHYVGHQNANKAALTVIENLRFWQRFLGGQPASAESDQRLLDAMERFELEPLADIPAGYLSAGQKRRLGLCRLLLAPRPLWLLDEPTVSLDAQSTALLAEIVGEHTAAGGLVLAATHLPLGLSRTRELRLGSKPQPGQTGAEAAP
ncbi:MAG: heme ABC exporter ATP-binding protein CcmA [Hyphomicrobiaceae bacterium]|nr:heme ABC exporter ATP-binding protein CcmA [Hyphomicrobiaceae bacterium]